VAVVTQAQSRQNLSPLKRVVTKACADLGHRVFRRAVKAYFVPVPTDGDPYVASAGRSTRN